MKKTLAIWLIVALLWAVTAVLELVSQGSWVVAACRFLAAVWFAVLGVWENWCMRRGPREQRIFRWTAMVSTVVILLIVVIQLF